MWLGKSVSVDRAEPRGFRWAVGVVGEENGGFGLDQIVKAGIDVVE